MSRQPHTEFFESTRIVIAVVEEGEIHGRDVFDGSGVLHGLIVEVGMVSIYKRENGRHRDRKRAQLPKITIEGKPEKTEPEGHIPSTDRHFESYDAFDELCGSFIVDLDQVH